jgi:hypothetical protein
VPGGFLHYLPFDKAPGVQLNWDLLWSYDREERDAIRRAFKAAWLYVDSIGFFDFPPRIAFPDGR